MRLNALVGGIPAALNSPESLIIFAINFHFQIVCQERALSWWVFLESPNGSLFTGRRKVHHLFDANVPSWDFVSQTKEAMIGLEVCGTIT
ncbi:hypothetical protein QQG55_33935 [Brugia pahangi]